MDIRATIYVDPGDTPTIEVIAGTTGDRPRVHIGLRDLGGLSYLDLSHGARTSANDKRGMAPLELADWLRAQADRVDLAWWQWLDEHAATYRFDEATKTFQCCGGYFEHFDVCEVRAQIDTARRALAKRDAGQPKPEVQS